MTAPGGADRQRGLVAGFLSPDIGAIGLDGRDVTGVPVFRRGIGMVFQDYALFPRRAFAENVAFGLRMQRPRVNSTGKREAGRAT